MINFKNKNILITGASGGIGNELIKKFVALGGNVLGSGTKTEKLDLLKKKLVNCMTLIKCQKVCLKRIKITILQLRSAIMKI